MREITKKIRARAKSGAVIEQTLTAGAFGVKGNKYPIVKARTQDGLSWSFKLTKEEIKKEFSADIPHDYAFIIIVDDYSSIRKELIQNYKINKAIEKCGENFENIKLSNIYKKGDTYGQHVYVDEFHFVVRNIFDFGRITNRHNESGYYSIDKNKEIRFRNHRDNYVEEISKREKEAYNLCENITNIVDDIRM